MQIEALDAVRAKKEELTSRHVREDETLTDKVRNLVRDRAAARAAKNWAESDRIRDELAAMGIRPKDNKDGTTAWEVAR